MVVRQWRKGPSPVDLTWTDKTVLHSESNGGRPRVGSKVGELTDGEGKEKDVEVTKKRKKELHGKD